ncbi:MAG: cupin domain-containing protein [Chitinophagaceae bacterium]|nr:MAG: cupin domain-containing protein [Chitinophagaceae bacterium]
MAYKEKQIHNRRNGQTFRFLQTAADTNGALLEMESTFREHSKEPPAHYHPSQDEHFTVLSGELTVRLGRRVYRLKQGEELHIPRRQVHSMWNAGSEKAVVNWKVRPALQTEHMLENFAGLANEGKTNENGVPNLLQTALLARHFSGVFRLARPSLAVQQTVFFVLAPFARLLGYRGSYRKYID